jgi:energy-coupling factor transporter transmembrane protein EcfT
MGGVPKKKKSKKALSKIFHISTWKLILVLILLVFLGATFLRFDHIKMSELREAVLAADEKEDNERILASLNELRNFTLKHIIFNILEENGRQSVIFGTGPFYLENLYIHDAKEAIAKQQAEIEEKGITDQNPNGNIFAKVAKICDGRARTYGWPYYDRRYLDCYTNELAKYPSSASLTTELEAVLPNTEDYRYDIASPIWYPCLSGAVILIAIILAFWIVFRIIFWVISTIALFILNH